MPPKNASKQTSVSSDQADAAATPNSRINRLSTEMSELKLNWKRDFDTMSTELRKDLKGELLDLAKKGNTDEEILRLIDDRIDEVLKKFELRWTSKFNILETKIDSLESNLLKMEDKHDSLDQYGRKKMLVIHGIKEMSGENPYAVMTDFFNNNFDCSALQTDFTNVHRMGKRKLIKDNKGNDTDEYTRPIIVEFQRLKQKESIFQRKKILKGTGTLIVENLTSERNLIYNDIRRRGFTCWTYNGNINILIDGKKIILRNLSEMKNFVLKTDSDKFHK